MNLPQSILFRRLTGKVFRSKELAASTVAACGRKGVFAFGSISIVASRWGVLCQVLEIYIASVDAGFGEFERWRGLDRSCGPARTARGFAWPWFGVVGGMEEGNWVPFGFAQGCGFTPAFGRAEGPKARQVYGTETQG